MVLCTKQCCSDRLCKLLSFFWVHASVPDLVSSPQFGTVEDTDQILQSRHGSWRVTGLLPWSATLFIAGYILRAIGAYHYDNLPIFISSLVLLYAAPPIYELSNYFVLSRLLHYFPHHSPIHPGRILTTFVGASFIVEVLTGNGAAKAANSASTPTEVSVGKALLKTALVLQLAILVLFVAIAARFHLNASRAGSLSKSTTGDHAPGSKVRAVILTLYVSTALISIRTIYRTVEYFSIASLHITSSTNESDLSPLLRYEWFFWVFESIPMFFNTVLLNWRHPGRYLPRQITTYCGQDGIEREGQGMKDHRSMASKFFDPFDFKGLVLGRDKNNRWWEQNDVVDAERVAPKKVESSS